VDGAPTLLGWVARASAALSLSIGLGLYYAKASELPLLSTWPSVAVVAFGLLPAVFGLVYLALPLREARSLPFLALGCGVAAVLLDVAGLDAVANFAKLAAVSFAGFLFVWFFEYLSWVVLVALIVPWVDIVSVFRGPTKHIIQHRENVFTALSFAFPFPGGGAARLGLPDLLFFALYLATAARFRLRVEWTWLAMVLSFGATLALATEFTTIGLPALPLLSLGFLLPNVDLIWRTLLSPDDRRDS
jgi:hypothetical protein